MRIKPRLIIIEATGGTPYDGNDVSWKAVVRRPYVAVNGLVLLSTPAFLQEA